MQETKLISALVSSREAYTRLLPLIKDNTFLEYNGIAFDEIKTFYNTDQKASKADVEILKDRAIKKYPKREALLVEYFSSLPEPPSIPNLIEVYTDVQKERIGQEIVQGLMSKKKENVQELMEQYLSFNVQEVKDELFNATPIEELEQHFTGKNLIPIYPTAISDMLGGGVPRQSQLCIFARPDTGKSVVAINAAVGAAENGFRVMYIGNEDPAPKMMYRIISRFTKEPEAELRKSPKKYFDMAIEHGYGNMFFVPMHPGNLMELRSKIERIKPDIFIIDQIRNMNFKKDSMTINLEQGCIGTRNLAKEFNCVSIVVTQAGDSARNKLVLDMEDVEWSNTGVAAQMDLMIGLGQREEMKAQGKIVLSFPKNKFTAPIKPFHANIEYAINRITT